MLVRRSTRCNFFVVNHRFKDIFQGRSIKRSATTAVGNSARSNLRLQAFLFSAILQRRLSALMTFRRIILMFYAISFFVKFLGTSTKKDMMAYGNRSSSATIARFGELLCRSFAGQATSSSNATIIILCNANGGLAN